MQIRPARPTDAPAIARLHAENWRAVYRNLLAQDYLSGPIESERQHYWHRQLAQPPANQHLIVAEARGRVIGFACAYGNDDPEWGTLLENLHVSTEFKHQGIGARLMAQVAHWTQHYYPGNGLYLWVVEPNRNAQAFYRHLGAQHVEDGIWQPPGGGEIAKLRFAWRQPETLLASNREITAH
jgi:GNAT superfamily N-acetyltransferase